MQNSEGESRTSREIVKVLGVGVRSFVDKLCSIIAVPHQIMKILIRYEGNGSSRYDENEYFESASKIRREKNVRGPLKIGEKVTIKTNLVSGKQLF